MAFEQVLIEIQTNLSNFGAETMKLLPNLVTAILLLIIGIFVGKFAKWLLKKILIGGLKLDKLLKYGFIGTLLTAVKWVIYILFLQASIVALKIPGFSDYLSQGLAIIPGVFGAILIIAIGYAIAHYLKTALQKTEKESLGLLGNILFFFIVFVAASLAIQAAFVQFEGLAEKLIIVLMVIGGAAIAGNYLKTTKKKRKS